MKETQQRYVASCLLELATKFEAVASNDQTDFTNESVIDQLMKLKHDAGVLLIKAHKQHLFDLAGLDELLRFHTGAQSRHPDPPRTRWEAGPVNLLHEIAGVVEYDLIQIPRHGFPKRAKAKPYLRVPGVLPHLFPDWFPMTTQSALVHTHDDYRRILTTWERLEEGVELRQKAVACRLIAELIETSKPTAPLRPLCLDEALRDAHSARTFPIRIKQCEPDGPAYHRLIEILRHVAGGPHEAAVKEIHIRWSRWSPDNENELHRQATEAGVTVQEYISQREVEELQRYARHYQIELPVASTGASEKSADGILIGQELDVWNALRGRSLKSTDLAVELDTSPENIRSVKSRCTKKGYVIEHRPGCGYYRPDAPPHNGATHA